MFTHEINTAAARGQPIRLWYTGLNINATAGSRAGWAVGATAALQSESELGVGSVVILDPFGHDKGKGIDCTRPQSSYLRNRAFVVVEIPKGQTDINTLDTASSLSNKRVGGWVEVVNVANSIDVMTKANMTAGATPLGIADASFALSAVTDSALDTTGEICPFEALAQETADTSTTPAVKKCQFGLWM